MTTIPGAIAKTPKAFGLVWTGPHQVNVPKNSKVPSKVRQFHTYIEVVEQSAHDAAIIGLVKGRGLKQRAAHRGQVSPENQGRGEGALPYYRTHGEESARIVADYMTQEWTKHLNTADTVFQPNKPYHPAVQTQRQQNGYYYEITMWYDVQDIYVAFHCYK